MIPKKDKRRQFAVERGTGSFETRIHNPSMAGAIGAVLLIMSGIALTLVLPELLGSGVALAVAATALSASGHDNVELVEARGELEKSRSELAKIFEESKVGDGFDFRKVKCLGEGKTSVDVRDRVIALNQETADLWQKCLKLAKAQDGPNILAEIERGRQDPGMVHAGPDAGIEDTPEAREKSRIIRVGAGGVVLNSEEYKAFRKVRFPKGEGINVRLDVYPSELRAKNRAKTLMTTAAGYAPQSIRLPGWVDAVTRELQISDIVPDAQTDQAAVAYMLETTRTHSAAEAAEGAAYAESAFVFTAQSVTVRKIADSLPVTDEQMEDVPAMEGFINNRLLFGVEQRKDTQILTGSGSGVNIEGIKNVTGIQTQALGTDNVPDAFFKAMTLIRVTGRAIPTHHVIHSTDWEGIRLLTTADGLYIWGSPAVGGMSTLWGLPVVQQDIDSAGTGYVGSFLPQWITFFEKRGVDIQVGYTGSQFTEGERTVRADMRGTLVVFRPAAFATVTGI